MLTITELNKFLEYIIKKQNLQIGFDKLKVVDSNPPHNPIPLPKGKMAVTVFEWNGWVLQISRIGAKSNARFQSQHYNPNSSQSNLAKNLLNDKTMGSANICEETVGDWIKQNVRRIDILLDENYGTELLKELKNQLVVRYSPKYGDHKQSEQAAENKVRKMRIDILTLFPEMCETVLNESIIGRARKTNKFEVYCHNIRDYSLDKHRRVDDSPYGGGMGLVMQAEPIYRAYEAIVKEIGKKPLCVYMSPRGQVFHQNTAKKWVVEEENILLICGHYEGIDQRLIDEIVDMELSIGDYVLTGGELAALVVADSVLRLCDGVLADQSTYEEESHYNVLLEYNHYTRPEVWHGRKVPEVLLSGHHKNIEKFRREQSIKNTFHARRELLQKAELTKEDIAYINGLEDDTE